MPQATDVSVIGLGKMGSALAAGLLGGGQGVTVWNRSTGKITPLVGLGAFPASTPAAAIESSPITIVCIDGYDATQRILNEAMSSLAGRTLIQLSTGTPRDAQEMETRIRSTGADYLDGAILAFPDDIATPTSMILIAGDPQAFDAAEAPLRILAPRLEYLGEQVGTASALDCAILSVAAGVMLGTMHGLAVAVTNGSLEPFSRLISWIAPLFADDIDHMTSVVREGSYADPPASVATWLGVMHRLRQQATDAGIDPAFPAFAAGVFDRAIAAGLGDQEPAAIAKQFHRG